MIPWFAPLRKSLEASLDRIGFPHVYRSELDPECRPRRLDGGHLANSRELTRVAQDRYTADARRDLLEQLEPFATDCKLELHESGHVAARSRQTRDQAAADRIGDLDENNRHSAGYFLQGFHAAAANGDDHVRRKRHQFRGVFPVLACIAGAPTILDADVDIMGPAQLLQPLLECRDLEGQDCGSSATRVISTPTCRVRTTCCARAESGHAAAAPPSAASNSRLPMVTVIRPSRARCVEGTIPRHERAVPNSAAPGAVKPGMDDEPVVMSAPPLEMQLPTIERRVARPFGECPLWSIKRGSFQIATRLHDQRGVCRRAAPRWPRARDAHAERRRRTAGG